MTPLALLVLVGAAAAWEAPGSVTAPFGGPGALGVLGQLPGAGVTPWIAGANSSSGERASSDHQALNPKNDSVNNGNGSSAYEYGTASGIRTGGAGVLKKAGLPGAVAKAMRDPYAYTDNAGSKYTVDEKGFQPQGAQKPTRPSNPVTILRSQKRNATEVLADARYQGVGSSKATNGASGGGFPGAYSASGGGLLGGYGGFGGGFPGAYGASGGGLLGGYGGFGGGFPGAYGASGGGLHGGYGGFGGGFPGAYGASGGGLHGGYGGFGGGFPVAYGASGSGLHGGYGGFGGGFPGAYGASGGGLHGGYGGFGGGFPVEYGGSGDGYPGAYGASGSGLHGS